MTMYRKRCSRRPVAAVVVAIVLASVLASVASTPVQAANTSSELLYDHDNNASTAELRQFGGVDRYDTALRLARQYAESRGGRGAVPTAFLASGGSLVDAVSVAGLAGYLGAPVLLTAPDALTPGVGNFIEDYGISNIWILGGTAAVSAGAEETVKALQNRPRVQRIAGEDRYETAAEIGRRLGGDSQWCGTLSNSAILVNGETDNGDTDSLRDAIIVSPLASRLQIPMLLTRADRLPQHTIDFIRDEDVEHVAIIGGQEDVDAAVSGALRSIGVSTVVRYAGTNAADTSAVVAELAVSGDCREDLAPVSTDAVALVSLRGVADGIAASPVLNGGVPGVDGLVPILLVGDSLPSSVRAYLAATPEEDSVGNKVEFKILAIGGNAAVTPTVMRAALNAAASAPALSVDIVAVDDTNGNGLFDDRVIDGATEFRLNFSDDIDPDVPSLTAKLLDAIRISGSPMVLASGTPVIHGAGGSTSATCVPDQVTVKLASPLRGGQTISLPSTSLQFGAASDKRPLTGDSVSVVTPSNSSPQVTITALIGQSSVWVDVTDPEGFAATEALLQAEVEPTKASKSGTQDLSVNGTPTASTTTQTNVSSRRFTVPLNRALVSGDIIKVVEGSITDLRGLKNSEKTQSAASAGRNPSLQSVWVSYEAHTSQARYVVPISITGGDGAAGGTPDVFFTARKSGAAAGANGNGWNFYFRRASTYSASQAQGKPLSLQVHVNESAKQAFVTFVDGVGKMADLKKALESVNAFDKLWEVSIEPASQTNTCVLANAPLTLPAVTVPSPATIATGYTMVALRAEFNTGHVKKVYGGELFDDILRAALAPTRANQTDKTGWAAITGVDIWRDKATFDNNGSPTGLYTFGNIEGGPLRRVRFEIRASEAKYLPRSNDRVIVTKGTDTTDSIAEGYDDSEPSPNPDNLVDPYRFNKATSTAGISISRTSSVSSPTG